ncbi:hypothetical protein LCGC14_0458150 [marine sediment metagenome]|uniref:Uncharacterized protein n=1 Tax=marine sediment metagenome TaxID=412755 RepID=A0A0F9SYW5_9ZZZZ
MSATAQNIKDFFALTGNNPAVENNQLTALSAWFSDHTGIETPTPDDFVDYIYTMFQQQVVSHKRATSAHTW